MFEKLIEEISLRFELEKTLRILDSFMFWDIKNRMTSPFYCSSFYVICSLLFSVPNSDSKRQILAN
jgi:hypothetical protein